VNIAICGENPTHVRGTHNIDNDFYWLRRGRCVKAPPIPGLIH